MKFSPRSGGSKGGKRYGGSGGGKKFAGSSPEHSGGRFSATCATCGKECQVPFKPNGRKPVLCSHCFKTGGSSSSEPKRFEGKPRFEGGSHSPSTSASDAQLKAIHAKLDSILELLQDL